MANANTISKANYTLLANDIGECYEFVDFFSDRLEAALTTVASLDGVEETKELINAFSNLRDIVKKDLETRSRFKEAVQALNNHVLKHARDTDGTTFNDVDTWLDTDLSSVDGSAAQASGTLSPGWGALSAAYGNTIGATLLKNDLDATSLDTAGVDSLRIV